MDEQQRKTYLKQTFDTVAEGYGTDGMEFFHNAAAHLPHIFKLRGHEHMLDVATGTGIAATAIAPHLPRGKITGIDLSEGMLAQLRTRTQNQGFDNIELHAMDMQTLASTMLTSTPPIAHLACFSCPTCKACCSTSPAK